MHDARQRVWYVALNQFAALIECDHRGSRFCGIANCAHTTSYIRESIANPKPLIIIAIRWDAGFFQMIPFELALIADHENRANDTNLAAPGSFCCSANEPR